MTNIRTVTLEFLRKGPPHNQLLSPLTDYIGVLGDYEATSINVPYEHAQLISRLKDLSYLNNESQSRRQEVLGETALKIGELLGKVEGFKAELANGSDKSDTLLHLNLVVTASELALLPFELAKVPEGLPGGGTNSLALIASPRVCITRQIRSMSGEGVQWPGSTLKRLPKILFVWAEPESTVPKEEHTQALLKAVLPWVPYFDPEDSDALNTAVRSSLTILPNATIQDVSSACSKETYTHIHVLAHGEEKTDTQGSPYGITLHSMQGRAKKEVVGGDIFAAALGRNSLPAVVTVAVCDSGHVRSVIHRTGASFAHDLHKAGIPLVVASQFPLTFPGSVSLVEGLYERLLWGADPRNALHDLRRTLYLAASENHDWASLVTYAALPRDLEDQLIDVRYIQANRATNAALDHIDKRIELARSPENAQKLEAVLDELFDKVNLATSRMPIKEEEGYETEGNGLLGSAEKRKAGALFKVSRSSDPAKKVALIRRSIQHLRSALSYYQKAFHYNVQETRGVVRRKRSLHWVLCQYLSLCAILGEKFSKDLWGMACVSAEIDLRADGEIRIWGHGSLWELYFLLLAYEEEALPESHENARTKAKEHLDQIRILDKSDDQFPIASTRRQIERYSQWWGNEDFIEGLNKANTKPRERNWRERGGINDLAEELMKSLIDF